MCGNRDFRFNKIYRKQLTGRYSFFTCNTYTDDDSFVSIERFTQTLESGGLTTETESQTFSDEIFFKTILTDTILSHTTLNTEDDSAPDSDCFDAENTQSCSTFVVLTCNSHSNTIITFTNKQY